MKLFRILLLLLLPAALLLLPEGSAHAQKGARGIDKGLDSITLRYRFKQGQRLRYRIVGFDSIMIYDVRLKTLVRERASVVVFRCDSVLPNDSGYIMTVTTTAYAATEHLDSLPPITRDTNDWVGRSTSFKMMPSGKRYEFVGGIDKPGTTAGGPFEPLVLPFLADEKTWIGSNGAYPNENWLYDNIYPPIIWDGTTFRAVLERKDTLKQKTVRLSYTDVGKIVYRMNGLQKGAVTQATINGGGEYLFSQKINALIAGSYNLIGKFTLTSPDGQKVDGRHLLGITLELLKDK
ncbi:MAG: hypothetical protein JWQ98_418 [Chlorobi bacterium]|nr:hypothetical protein [Chlorobiota bacterium]